MQTRRPYLQATPPTSPITDAENDASSVEATLCWIRDDFEHCSELQVLRHFTTDPIKNIHSSFDRAVGIVIDLQFHSQNPKVASASNTEPRLQSC